MDKISKKMNGQFSDFMDPLYKSRILYLVKIVWSNKIKKFTRLLRN
jgi:hypothetical protein